MSALLTIYADTSFFVSLYLTDRHTAEHRAQNLWRETPLPDRTFEVCAQLAHQHAARLGVRTLDTLHVASALELKADHFWTFDGRQAQLALAASLKTR